MSDFTKKHENLTEKKQAWNRPARAEIRIPTAALYSGQKVGESVADMHLSWQRLSHKLKADLGEAINNLDVPDSNRGYDKKRFKKRTIRS